MTYPDNKTSRKNHNNEGQDLHLSLSGTLGKDYNSKLTLDGRYGTFTFSSHKNWTLELDSYDPYSGRLILKAYSSKGEFIGTLDGTLEGHKLGCEYYGIWNNLGKSVKFNYN